MFLCHEDFISANIYNGNFSLEYGGIRKNKKYILDQKVNIMDKEI